MGTQPEMMLMFVAECDNTPTSTCEPPKKKCCNCSKPQDDISTSGGQRLVKAKIHALVPEDACCNSKKPACDNHVYTQTKETRMITASELERLCCGKRTKGFPRDSDEKALECCSCKKKKIKACTQTPCAPRVCNCKCRRGGKQSETSTNEVPSDDPPPTESCCKCTIKGKKASSGGDSPSEPCCKCGKKQSTCCLKKKKEAPCGDSPPEVCCKCEKKQKSPCCTKKQKEPQEACCKCQKKEATRRCPAEQKSKCVIQ